MDKAAIIRHAWDELEPHLTEQGYELVEVVYTRQSGTPVLRLYIDKPGGGIGLDDCTAASQLLNPVLDAADFAPEQYMLEVSSPGVDRPLRKPAHFTKYIGELVRVETNAPLGGRQRFKGALSGFEDGLIQLDCDGEAVEIHIENLKRAHLDR